MTLDIRTVEGGPLQVNTYVVGIEGGDSCVVIDPGVPDIQVNEAVAGRTVSAVLLTHGHFDHIQFAGHWLDKGAKLYVHENDAEMIRQPHLNLAVFVLRQGLRLPEPDVKLREGDTVCEAGMTFTVLHTPGHTEGSVCYLADGILFSGDTMFQHSYGRTDFPGGSDEKMFASLERLLDLHEDTVVYPGHGMKTKIAWERRYYGENCD
ncbi:MAG: MBL fold metallo-hydrolase [Clostridia bacterium]|nr:MBL fold metallo-hydrolase [Clostridia bacterium]